MAHHALHFVLHCQGGGREEGAIIVVEHCFDDGLPVGGVWVPGRHWCESASKLAIFISLMVLGDGVGMID